MFTTEIVQIRKRWALEINLPIPRYNEFSHSLCTSLNRGSTVQVKKTQRSAHALVATAADYLVTPEFDGPIKWGC